MPTSKIKTGLDKLVALVNKRGEIKLADAGKLLGLDDKTIKELAKILVEHEIVEIHYSIVGDKILKKGKKLREVISPEQVVKHVDETLKKKTVEEVEEAERVDRLLGVMKKKIAKKRREGVIETTQVAPVQKRPIDETRKKQLEALKKAEDERRQRAMTEVRRKDEELREEPAGAALKEKGKELARIKRDSGLARRKADEEFRRRELELKRKEEELKRKNLEGEARMRS